MRIPLPVLGWKEQVSLPDWGIPRMRAKLDTGARSSALHVEDVAEIDEHDHDGERFPVLKFHVITGLRNDPKLVEVVTPSYGTRTVRDTGAKAEVRHVVRTRIVCGPVDVSADITLTSRHGMNFRMLLGRLALQHACLVDPAHGYLHTPTPPQRRR